MDSVYLCPSERDYLPAEGSRVKSAIAVIVPDDRLDRGGDGYHSYKRVVVPAVGAAVPGVVVGVEDPHVPKGRRADPARCQETETDADGLMVEGVESVEEVPRSRQDERVR